MDDLMKLSPDIITRYLREFERELDTSNSYRKHSRLVTRGAWLKKLSVALEERLSKGWTYLNDHPMDDKNADVWFQLLDLYERINDVLKRAESSVDFIQAAKDIFKADEVPNG